MSLWKILTGFFTKNQLKPLPYEEVERFERQERNFEETKSVIGKRGIYNQYIIRVELLKSRGYDTKERELWLQIEGANLKLLESMYRTWR